MSIRSLLPFVVALAIGCSGSAPIDGQVSDRAERATDLGRMAPDAPIDFVVGLALREPTVLHRYLGGRGIGDEPLAPDDFADLFAPTAKEYGRVVSWLEAHGALVTRTAPGRTTVSAHAPASVVEQLVGVELHQYSDADGSFFAASGPIRIANELVGTVNGVVGLSGVGYWKTHFAWPNLGAGAALAPSDMEMLYGSSAITNPGMGETVAILGTNIPPDATADIGSFMTKFKPYGLSSAPGYTQFLLGGPNRDPPDPGGAAVENALDAEMVLSMAPLATIVHVLAATNTPGLFADGISYIVNQLPKAHAVSVSYGTCERGEAQEAAVFDTLLAQAQAEGQQWFFASGDSGTDGCRDHAGNMHITAGWPASSPHAIGVGGTMIGNGGVEIAWNQNTVGPRGEAAGGGGPSEIFSKPAYQMGKTPNDNARDTPDVAAIAGGGGVFLAYQNQFGTIEGTSAATPVVAGAWALVDQGAAAGKGITDAHTKIYAIGTSGAFNDVTMGDNGGPTGEPGDPGFAAAAGYDLATGWGSPNVAQIIAHIQVP